MTFDIQLQLGRISTMKVHENHFVSGIQLPLLLYSITVMSEPCRSTAVLRSIKMRPAMKQETTSVSIKRILGNWVSNFSLIIILTSCEVQQEPDCLLSVSSFYYPQYCKKIDDHSEHFEIGHHFFLEDLKKGPLIFIMKLHLKLLGFFELIDSRSTPFKCKRQEKKQTIFILIQQTYYCFSI